MYEDRDQVIAERAVKELDLNATQDALRQQVEEQPKKIGEPEIKKATDILKKYKEGKARLEQKLIANEEFWKLRQWKYIREGDKDTNGFDPATPWLWACIQSRYSDAMDSYPTCNIQPRQEDDKGEARILSEIIPVILSQNDYEATYSDFAWYILKQGGGVQGVFWDGSKHNGLGDIAVKNIDFINLFWEPGIKDIQQSPNIFHTELVDNALLVSRYPQCEGKLGGKPITLARYIYDEKIDTTDKSVVVDWYYKRSKNGRETLQYAKFVNDILLYATENDTEVPTTEQFDDETGITMTVPSGASMADRGLYDHGMYPFVVSSLYPIEGSLCGYGLTDIGRDTQMEIDLINKAITENAIACAKPRYFFRDDGTVNEEEFCDMDKEIVHVKGSLNDEALRPIQTSVLSGTYLSILDSKVQELKFCTSNQDSNNGVAPSGVTAGSAIAALQEAAGKNARSSNKVFHRAFREVVYQVIELIRQFYDTPRQFRIAPDAIGEQYITYSNQGLVPQAQQGMDGADMGLRTPEFDIEVTTEKDSPYKKMENNELALSFYQNGFFNPQMSDQVLGCLQMMDFKKKNEVIQTVQANGTMYQQLIKYQQIALQLAKQVSPQLADQLARGILQEGGQPIPSGDGQVLPEDISTGEHPYNEKARAQSRASTQAD